MADMLSCTKHQAISWPTVSMPRGPKLWHRPARNGREMTMWQGDVQLGEGDTQPEGAAAEEHDPFPGGGSHLALKVAMVFLDLSSMGGGGVRSP